MASKRNSSFDFTDPNFDPNFSQFKIKWLLFLLYKVEATEMDPDSPVVPVTVPVHVTLLDENDNSPTFSRTTYEGKVFANQTVGMVLVQVSQPNKSGSTTAK